ncbi:MAG: hypothetical protein EOO36_07450 [Cytophagaceae bacterium]|nr:MAG: hypothetical protein EOO36_07450 [Cytophagaceae bacterium]
MNQFFSFCSLGLLLGAAASCQRTPPTATGPGLALAGTWRLSDYQCHCPPGHPVPDEVLTFDANQHFRLLRDKKLAAEGTYSTGKGISCGGGTPEPIITLTPTAADIYAPHGAYTLEGSTLIIDQCSAADGPKYTYIRQ